VVKKNPRTLELLKLKKSQMVVIYIAIREQKSVQDRFVSKLFRMFTTFPSQGTVTRIGYLHDQYGRFR